jgi:hypothetical protein
MINENFEFIFSHQKVSKSFKGKGKGKFSLCLKKLFYFNGYSKFKNIMIIFYGKVYIYFHFGREISSACENGVKIMINKVEVYQFNDHICKYQFHNH